MLKTTKLNDLSPMPFGKYKGVPMQDIDANYLHWFYMNCFGPHTEDIRTYIRENIDALKMENPDLIWSDK